jgi:hypothetical protein
MGGSKHGHTFKVVKHRPQGSTEAMRLRWVAVFLVKANASSLTMTHQFKGQKCANWNRRQIENA